MNAKFALALILTLQVSVTFCEEVPQELLQKYLGLRDAAIRRADSVFPRIVEFLDSINAPMLKEQVEALPTNPKVVAGKKIIQAVGVEVDTLVENNRNKALTFYNDYLREYLRPVLEQLIPQIQGFLDQVVPSETN